ncbi:MAG: hypothetical protein LBL36_01730 [Clostridiales Family XIII bacterium]|jgi:hypothetical protein|nr:hypothetical protein [Clostridiales Family XIII bacterium]
MAQSRADDTVIFRKTGEKYERMSTSDYSKKDSRPFLSAGERDAHMPPPVPLPMPLPKNRAPSKRKRISREKNLLIAAAALFLIYFFINQAFKIDDNNGKKYYEEYINNSINLQVSIVEIDPDRIEEAFTSVRYMTGVIRFKGVAIDYQGYKFKDSITKKWFHYLDFGATNDGGHQARLYALTDNLDVTLKVNKDEWEDKDLGAFENPIPVLSFESEWLVKQETGERENAEKFEVQKAAAGEEFTHQEFNFVITRQAYERNVISYLTHVMPRKEFKEMFKKQ